ncbi:peptide ABC transporter substrate-binding protein [Oceanobacillus chungangensis]|uniref:Peptide ABC transporter substrate-binding protein n=1 Tax=Oceanobacillus chungangensis TaxID=1229152 RepID=A0A3D8PWX6_9BACI|nr:peptide ABC transporter substrate-binding protein [Oceanobacillus chungangensis]RDW20603.1 peptide ABC transporter substrate-binding protein [Oceanobacillus chungangensis]
MKYIKKFIAVLIILSFVLAACSFTDESKESTSESNTDSKATTKEKVVRLSAAGEIPGLDPTLADNDFSFNVINQVFEGLYRLDKDGEPQLALAAKEPEVTKDGKVLTFTLREDAVWSDGSPVTAHDFEYSWKRAVDPETSAAYGPTFEEILVNATEILVGEKPVDELGVKALDDKTLKVTLENPAPFFKELLTIATFMPQKQEFIEEQGDKYATDSEHTLFNGPFVLSNWESTDLSWNYEKNDQYWDKDAVNVDSIEVNVVKDSETAVNLYLKGQLDRVELTSDNVKQFQGEDEFATTLTGAVAYLKMNQGKDGETTDLANLNIRKALNIVIDKQIIVDALLNNGSIVANAYVPKGLAENPATGEDFRTENGDLTEFNLEKGLGYWQKGLEELGKTELEFTLIGKDSSESKKLAENLKYQMESKLPGLTINIRNLTPKASIAANVGQDYELIITGWLGDYRDPLAYLNLYYTDSPGNHTGYADPEYDKHIHDSKTNLSYYPEERWEALLKAERLLIEENAVLLPLYQEGISYMQKDYIKDLITYPVSSDNYKWIDIIE